MDLQALHGAPLPCTGSDRVTRIYACATMWHEEPEEMMECLKSVFRVDADYSSRRLAQKYVTVL